jgi:hypothetical protein
MAINSAEVARLREEFHRFLNGAVNCRLSSGDQESLDSYANDLRGCGELLAANPLASHKPGILELTNCIFIYKDPYADFWEAFKADPLTAVWAGHYFWCKLEKDCMLAICICFFSGGFRNTNEINCKPTYIDTSVIPQLSS